MKNRVALFSITEEDGFCYKFATSAPFVYDSDDGKT